MAPLNSLRQELGSTELSRTFQNYKQQIDEQDATISNRLTILEILREHYPEHHVTCVNKSDFDLEGFANDKQTHATLTLQANNQDGAPADMYDSVNEYMAPRRRLDGETGSVRTEYSFVHYELTWNGQRLPVYFAKWPTPAKWDEVSNWFIVVPRSAGEVSEQGHHALTEEIILEVGIWSTDLHEEIWVFDDSSWRKSKSLYHAVKGASWDDVIMDPKIKSGLVEDVQGFFNSRDLYRKFKVGWKRGIILHGLPGNGKTTAIKALVNYLAQLEKPIPSLYVKTLDNKCNMPQWEVREIFKKARSVAPCLMILEDLDSLVSEKVRSYFLNEVDGLESNDGILMIGSTNHLARLDPAIAKRPSRFDRKYHFQIPDRAQRIAYGEYWRTKLTDNMDVDFPSEICPLIADLTDGFSFAYMKELIVMSLMTVARGGKGDAESDWEEVSESPTPPAEEDKKDEEVEEDSDDSDDEIDCEKCKKREIKKKRKEKKAKAKEAAEAEKQKQKKIRTVPVIEAPDELKENVLLKVMQQQVKILIHEMDNTEDEEEATDVPKKADSGAGCMTC